MTHPAEVAKAELLEQIDETWPALNEALDQMTVAQFAVMTDAAGWTVKDHVVHLADWELSALYALQGRPRYTALGVDELAFKSGDFESINEMAQARSANLSAAEARAHLSDVHDRLMQTLATWSDEDLGRSARFYLTGEPDDEDSYPVMNTVYGDTAAHFREHLQWMLELVQGGESSR